MIQIHRVMAERWKRSEFYELTSVKSKLEQPFGLLLLLQYALFYNAISSWLCSRWHSHVFSTNLYCATSALFIKAAGSPTRLWAPQAKDSALFISVYLSPLSFKEANTWLAEWKKALLPLLTYCVTLSAKAGAGTRFSFAGGKNTHWPASP